MTTARTIATVHPTSRRVVRPGLRSSDILIRAAIVALTLATAYIHSTLGGLLFTLNAVGYVVAALAMVIPLGLAIRFRSVANKNKSTRKAPDRENPK